MQQHDEVSRPGPGTDRPGAEIEIELEVDLDTEVKGGPEAELTVELDAGPGTRTQLDLDCAPDVLPQARRLTDEAEILGARRLHAREYVRVGYVGAGALAPDGTLLPEADPWAPHAAYFGAFDPSGRISATARVLPDTAGMPLPTLVLPTLDDSALRRLGRIRPGRLGEISALARRRDADISSTRATFRALWVHALEQGLEAYVLNVDALVLRTLRAMTPHLFRVAGPATPAPVRPVYPVWLEIADVRGHIFTQGLPAATVKTA